MKKEKITFVIPTKNRTNYLVKLIRNCEKIFTNLNYEYLIIDASNNLFHNLNLRLKKEHKNIRIFRQKSKGIQLGCFESISKVKTKYVVFLYDDDELSNYISKIYLSNNLNKNIFSFGYGIVKPLNEKIKFYKLKENKVNKNIILSGYFGININNFIKTNFKNKILLPLSPICTTYSLSFLKKWRKTILSFVYKNPFRYYFFLKKEVGPDLLIYLISIHESKKVVKLFTPYSAKFSSHDQSISIIYGSNFLRIGYWLSKVCFFSTYHFADNNLKNKMYTFLITSGLFLLITNIFNFYYFKNIFLEIQKIIKKKGNKFIFSYSINLLINRILK